MKYVITDHNKVVLGNGAYHQDLAAAITGTVVAAGHCEIKDGKVHVFGESVGFGLKAKPEDAAIIEEVLKN